MRNIVDFVKLYGSKMLIKQLLVKMKITNQEEYEKDIIRFYHGLDERDYPMYLERWYKYMTGRKIDLSNPIGFSQKLQWMKVYGMGEKEKKLSDKFAVREWISKTIGSEFLIPLLGVYDNFDEIDFSTLPNRFVMKTNHGTANVIVVKDKDKLDVSEIRKKFMKWLSMDYSLTGGFELQYKGIDKKIIIEQYVEDSIGELSDYKFLCVNGSVQCLWCDKGRFSNHTRSIYDINWNKLDVSQFNYGSMSSLPQIPYDLEKPVNFEEMIRIAEKLSDGFCEVRVDLYNVDGKIYFGEMTFTSGSGIEIFRPDEFDRIIGDAIVLPVRG